MKSKRARTIALAVTAFAASFTGWTGSAAALGPNAVSTNAGCYANAMFRNDDSFVSGVGIGFPVNFFGTTYTTLAVNNNGNVTFDGGMSDYTPFPILTTGRRVIAPFFGDVDTRNGVSDVTRWGSSTFDGRPALCVTWAGIGVGYYSFRVDKLNNFQLLLVDRSDVASGDFDIVFNYDRIEWETGEASGGVGGLGGASARAGWASGTTAYELAGSAVNGALLDSNSTTGLIHNKLNTSQLGRYVFFVRNGVVLPPEDTTAPVLSLPADMTVEATGATGEAVSYTVTATDDVDPSPAVECSPASGSTFPLGETTVDCTATDAAGNSSSESFTVTVEDTTAPALSLPANITAEATSLAGAVVSYSASATDAVDPSPSVSCSPVSGGTFALGTTTVGCTATDATGNGSSGSFTVTVRDTTAPAVTCVNGPNPSGKNKPNGNAGFRTITATDPVGVVTLQIVDSASSFVSSNLSSGWNLKLTQSPGNASEKNMAGVVSRHINTTGAPKLRAVDAAGNVTQVDC